MDVSDHASIDISMDMSDAFIDVSMGIYMDICKDTSMDPTNYSPPAVSGGTHPSTSSTSMIE